MLCKFLFCHHRHGFGHVRGVVEQLLGVLHAAGEGKVVDMASMLKREALDVIGARPWCC